MVLLPSSESFTELGRRAALRFAEQAVEMAECVESAGETYLRDGEFGRQQHSRNNAQAVIDDESVGGSACFVPEET